jgi:hypothetical protein
VRDTENLSSFGRVPGVAGAFASAFPALASFPFSGGMSAGNTTPIQMPARRPKPFRAPSRINVAETAKAPLDMTAAVVEATPHSSWRILS